MVWRAIQRGNASDGPPSSVTQADIDAPHVEAITSQRNERWIIDDRPNDGWSVNTPAPLLEMQSFEEDLDELQMHDNHHHQNEDASSNNSNAHHSRTGSMLSSSLGGGGGGGGGRGDYARSDKSQSPVETL